MDRPLAIGRRLARFPEILTLGPRPNLSDYTEAELALIQAAAVVFYPTAALAPQLVTAGKRIFPSLECHLYEGDKIKQLALWRLLGIPIPRTKVYWGRQRRAIAAEFGYPFVAKTPRASAGGRGVFLITGPAELEAYLAAHNPAYIQQYLPQAHDVRVVVVGFEPVAAYRRLPAGDDFRANLAAGGRVSLAGVPPEAVDLAVRAARTANLDEVGLDVIVADNKPMVLEFNAWYGRTGPALAGVDVQALVAGRILAGKLPPP